MFGINNKVAQAFWERKPHTFTALQHLVMAMDDCAKHVGQRTLFGRDKTQEYLTKLALQLSRTIDAMRTDGLLTPFAEPQAIHEDIQSQLSEFFEAFPTWARAMAFSLAFFNEPMSMEIIKAKVWTDR
ncbi:hypothetical protein [Ralstonia solanacearum]|uniref:hypothetical protein n=1 Tax=Ralstonia solanacearum TaxID=305 RepID=UPI0018D12A91|nr:hypothetical protein [Ralstonia solanacearum]